MSADLTADAARAERDELVVRTDVLDRVGVLRTLPDDMSVTTEMAAEFYLVDPDLIRYHVKTNRDELDDDGYRVVGRTDFEREFGSLSNLNPHSRSIGLMPRRAVLRLGMLLRDSPVARRVRDYLLDAEQVSPARAVDEDEKLFEAFQILNRRVERLAVENRTLAEKIDVDAPKVGYVERYVADGDLLKLRTVAANNDVGEEWLRDLLVAKGWVYVETEKRFSESKGCVEIKRRYSAYSHKRSYFRPVERHDVPRFKGEVMHTLKVTPFGAEAISRLVAKEMAA
jgi:phage antirepressor YoqD-like protein